MSYFSTSGLSHVRHFNRPALLCLSSLAAIMYVSPVKANSVSWNLNAGNGSWDVGNNWSGGSVPTASDDVLNSTSDTIIVGDYTSDLNYTSTTSFAKSLTNSGGGELLNEYTDTLTIGSSCDNSNGSSIVNDGYYQGGVGFSTPLFIAINLQGGLTNNDGSVEVQNGAIDNITGTSVLNESGSLLNSDGIYSSYDMSSELYLGDSSGYNPLTSLNNESNSTVSATNGGVVNILAEQTTNSYGSTIQADGVDPTGSSQVSTINFNSVQAPDNPMPSNSILNSGIFEATNGGTISVGNNNFMGQPVTFTNESTGTVYVGANSSINLGVTQSLVNAGNIQIMYGGQLTTYGDINQTAGTTKVDGELTLVGDTQNVGADTFNLQGGTLNGIGTINSSNISSAVLNGNVNQTGGTFNPGEDPSAFTLNGNYIISGGNFQIEIASISSFDMLNVSGSTNITGGTLSLDFLNGFVPSTGQTYDFLQATNGISGDFSSFNSNLSGTSFSFNNGMLTILGAPPAVPESGTAASLMLLLVPAGVLAARRASRLPKASVL